jgi:hypothetical protein
MPVVNLNYSTLEDVWGPDPSFDKTMVRKKRPNEDPLLNLYNKRTNKLKRPYLDKQTTEVSPFFKDQNTWGSYSRSGGGSVGRAATKPLQQQQKQHESSGFIAPTKRNTYYGDLGGYDDDDEYFERVLSIEQEQEKEQEDEQEHMMEYKRPLPIPKSAASPPSPPAVRHQRIQDSIEHAKQPRSKADKMMDFGLYVATGIFMLVLLDLVLSMGMKAAAKRSIMSPPPSGVSYYPSIPNKSPFM